MTLYFDTSAVLALAFARADSDGEQGVHKRELTRASEIRAFVARCSGTAFRTTILAMQEVAHAARIGFRNYEAKERHFTSWRKFLDDGDATDVAEAEARAHGYTIQMLERAVLEMQSLGIELERSCVTAAERLTAATRLRRQHAALIRACPHIDSMDALHILKGIELGALGFVSFDGDWLTVPNITVFQ